MDRDTSTGVTHSRPITQRAIERPPSMLQQQFRNSPQSHGVFDLGSDHLSSYNCKRNRNQQQLVDESDRIHRSSAPSSTFTTNPSRAGLMGLMSFHWDQRGTSLRWTFR